MDDFRVGSTPPLDAYRETGERDTRKRRKNPTPSGEPAGDAYVSSEEQAAGSAEAAEDFYTPSEPTEAE